MRRWLLVILGVFSFFSVFSQGNLNWPDPSCSTDNITIGNDLCEGFVTNSNATIAVQTTAFSNITLEGNNTIPSNAYIGVFYSDGINYSCGGFSQWPDAEENFTIIAYGNDFLTPDLQDGFVNGEEYTWFLRINNSDNPLDGWTDYIGENLIMDSSMSFQENWAENAFANLLSVDFVLYSEWTNCMDISACNYNQAVVNTIVDFDQDFINSALEECEYPENEWLNCEGNCANDEDGDGICNNFEIPGCQDENAVNYNASATDSYYDSDPFQPVNCYFIGCTDPDALNYDENANANGPCDYPVYQLNWNYTGTGSNATFAITSINGIPDYDFTMTEEFCQDVTVGAFYNNNEYDEVTNLYDDEFSGYSNGSIWNCSPTQSPYPYITIFGDDNLTAYKDGFNANEPLILVVELGGEEYLVEPVFVWTGYTLNTAEFANNGMYIAELNVIEPVLFGCMDINYVDYWDYNFASGGISFPIDPPNFQDPNACTTPMVIGCMDPAAENFIPLANVNPLELNADLLSLMEDNVINDGCSYLGCTDSNYLEYFNYDPINYSISELSPLPDIDNGSCNTLIVYGCTLPAAFNYNSVANVNDDSCIPVIEGCTDSTAYNYNDYDGDGEPNPLTGDPFVDANTDFDGLLCVPFIYGCMDGGLTEDGDGVVAYNYDPFVNTDDGSCVYVPGCTNEDAFNYNPLADYDDDSCIEIVEGCMNSNSINYNSDANVDDGSCQPFIYGCMDSTMWNYNPLANTEDNSCIPFAYGCTDPIAFNYDSSANTDDGNCQPFIYGCMDADACNFIIDANTADGSCAYADIYYDCDGNCLVDTDSDGVCDELELLGCTDSSAFNYDLSATEDDGSCIPVVLGCTVETAFNYDSSANLNDYSCCFLSGCTDNESINYNENACYDDGSCIEVILGCIDPSMFNYNSNANTDDGSCVPYVYGCTDDTAFNYNPLANVDFGGLLCEPVVEGCTDETAYNYNLNANTDDNSCIEAILGCTDSDAYNYDANANTDDDSCISVVYGCTDSSAVNYNPNANTENNTCFYLVWGCTNPNAHNYDEEANINDGSCVAFIYGCMDAEAFNYDEEANTDDGSCVPVVEGCTSPYYINYDEEANTDDGSCIPYVYGCTDDAAFNYNPLANADFGGLLCVDVVEGCMDETAYNYNLNANTDDNSCIPVIEGCADSTAYNYNDYDYDGEPNSLTGDPFVDINTDDGSCIAVVLGCMNPISFNFNPDANSPDPNDPCCLISGCTDETAYNFDLSACYDDGSCEPVIEGCTDSSASNYEPTANTDDGSCIPFIFGCTDIEANNYDPLANIDFGGLLCNYAIYGCTDPTMFNYDPEATDDDDSCEPFIFGCTDPTMFNYDSSANTDFNGALCEPFVYGCINLFSFNYNPLANTDDGSCIPFIFGCTDSTAFNYDPLANIDFGGLLCSYQVLGCTDSTAFNYDSGANTDDGSCIPVVEGCIDSIAFNYDSAANTDDGSCVPVVEGCIDSTAYNYNDYDGDGEPNPLTGDPFVDANTDDGSCVLVVEGCTDSTAFNHNPSANVDDGTCVEVIEGCMDPTMFNYNPDANTDDGLCIAFIYGCTDSSASNYNPDVNTDDGSCIEEILGCLYPSAINFDISATVDDGSCIFSGCTDDSPGDNPDLFGNYDSNGNGYAATNYNPNASVDDGTCLIYGCIWDYWFICPESYNGDATVGDWDYCTLVFDGCEVSALELPLTGSYPTLLLADLVDHQEAIYYNLGQDKIGCMDKLALNYSVSAVLDDGSCLFQFKVHNSNHLISIYPQPAQGNCYVSINLVGIDNHVGDMLYIQNIIGETVFMKEVELKTNLIELDIDHLTTGVYYLLIELNNKLITKRLIVE